MNINLTPNITGANVSLIKGATQADLTNAVNNSKFYRDESQAFSIVSKDKAIESASSALNSSASASNALIYRNEAESFANSINSSNIVHISGTETITGDKTFTGTISGLNKNTVGLNNVDNTSDSVKNVLYAATAGTASASDVYSWAKAVSKPSYTASEVGLGNVTNESKATMFTSPTFTSNVTLPSTTSIGTISSTELGYIDGVTSSIQTQLNNKANDSDVIKLTGDQTIAGIKTFSSFPITPSSAPTTNYQVANKKYVDDKLVASSETAAGIIELATTAEAQAGTDNSRAITPLKLRNALNASGTAPIYACRAWVNFNGTGTVAIRASGNVSSITDNGTGEYRGNFIVALPDSNYATNVSFNSQDGNAFFAAAGRLSNMQSTTSFAIESISTIGNMDCPNCYAAIFR